MCLRIPASLRYRAQAEKCMVIDEAEIVRLQIGVHTVYFTTKGYSLVLASARANLFKLALDFSFSLNEALTELTEKSPGTSVQPIGLHTTKGTPPQVPASVRSRFSHV